MLQGWVLRLVYSRELEWKKSVSKINLNESVRFGEHLKIVNEGVGGVKHISDFLHGTIGKWVVTQRQLYRKGKSVLSGSWWYGFKQLE